MYREDEFYYLTDRFHHDIYNIALRNHGVKESRVIIKIFKKNKEEIVMESVNGVNTIIKDTRTEEKDITNYDLVFVKSLDRYTSDYELKGMVYESIEGIGSWYRVKIDGFDPKDKDLKIFYNKKKVTKEMIENSDVSIEIKQKQLEFLSLTENLSFTSPKKIKKVLNNY